MDHLIAIDGPSGSGKSTLGLALAEKLGWNFLDSGIFYRVAGYLTLKQNMNPNNLDDITKLVTNLDITLDKKGKLIKINGDEFNHTLLQQEKQLDQMASKVAKLKIVRDTLLSQQRSCFNQKIQGLVVVGRDIGTIVFPNAPLKLYLTASSKIRAARRFKQINCKYQTTLNEIENAMISRDKRDFERKEAPLKMDSDYVKIDTSNLSLIQSLDKAINLWENALVL
jgi:CMP/dCMP kinase